MPPEEEEDLYGDIEEAIGLSDGIDADAMFNTPTGEAPSVDPAVLSLADSKLNDEFVQAESGLKDVPWVGVSGKSKSSPSFSDSRDAQFFLISRF